MSRIGKSMGMESRQVVARGEVGVQRAWGIFFEREIDWVLLTSAKQGKGNNSVLQTLPNETNKKNLLLELSGLSNLHHPFLFPQSRGEEKWPMKSCGFSLIHSSFKRNRLRGESRQLQEKFLREEAPVLDPGALAKAGRASRSAHWATGTSWSPAEYSTLLVRWTGLRLKIVCCISDGSETVGHKQGLHPGPAELSPFLIHTFKLQKRTWKYPVLKLRFWVEKIEVPSVWGRENVEEDSLVLYSIKATVRITHVRHRQDGKKWHSQIN